MTDMNVNQGVQIVAQTVESKVAVITHLISCVSDDRQIDLSDMDVQVEDLPKETKKLLCEKIFPKDFIRNYHRIREQAEEILDKNGSIKTALGGVNTIDSAIAKIAELDALKAAWNAQLEKDEARYVDMCEAHILKIGSAAIDSGVSPVMASRLTAHLIKRRPTWEEVKKTLQFAYVVHIIDLDGSEFIPELQQAQRDSVVALREGVMGACVQHVCAEALAISKLIDSKDRTTSSGLIKLNPRTIRRARAMTEKLEPLAFIHKLIKPLHDALVTELAKLPDSGHMTAGEFANFEQCLIALKDQRKVVDSLQKGCPLIAVVPAVTQTPSPASAGQVAVGASTVQGMISTQHAAAAPAVTVNGESKTTVGAFATDGTVQTVLSDVDSLIEEQSIPVECTSVPGTLETSAFSFYL